MEDYDPEKPEINAFAKWGIIRLGVIDDNGFEIQRGYVLNVIKVKDGIVYALPAFEPS